MSRYLSLLLLIPMAAQAQLSCELKAMPIIADIRLTSAEKLDSPAPHCKVAGIIGSEIRFELLMPDDWNGKFVMGGGGGFVGSVQNSALAFNALGSGYATVGTDTGHQGGGVDARWALNNAERIANFGYLAVHRTAVTAKSLIRDFYNADIQRNYFMGCSRGGGQALMEAQRFPDDFDGIVAGAPAYNWTGLAAQGIRIQQAMFPDSRELSAALISPAEQALLESAILNRCDALDGISDGILNDPRQCDFDVTTLPACAAGDNDECFTDAEVAAIQEIYTGPEDARGELLFYGYPFGGESDRGGWSQWLTGGLGEQTTAAVNGQQPIPNAHFGFSNGIMKYMVFHDADWDYASYDFEQFGEDTSDLASILNATGTDLSAFRNSGGKLLIYQGWSDPAITALGTIGYYESMLLADPAAQQDVRLFMLPGVLHCGGGKGPSQVDFLSAIDQWVESNVAPDQLIARYPPANDPASGSRPLCQYPELARYNGDGNDRDAASFSCARP